MHVGDVRRPRGEKSGEVACKALSNQRIRGRCVDVCVPGTHTQTFRITSKLHTDITRAPQLVLALCGVAG